MPMSNPLSPDEKAAETKKSHKMLKRNLKKVTEALLNQCSYSGDIMALSEKEETLKQKSPKEIGLRQSRDESD